MTDALAPNAGSLMLTCMRAATAQLLEEFDRLPADEQREFSSVIVRRAAMLDYGDVTDEELTASAARMFAMFDAEEDAQAG
jgi:hypothetical protein